MDTTGTMHQSTGDGVVGAVGVNVPRAVELDSKEGQGIVILLCKYGTIVPISEPQHQKKYLRTCANSEYSDQPAHSRSLMRIFTGAFWIEIMQNETARMRKLI